ncbi:MAG: tetratricopeptide repeat protein [Deltaproteobacteria bacterium]|nr:tetratricopeptide repeat protein [Deltaproteobacteria bacterium]
MSLDRDKVFASAQKYLQKGQVDKAIQEYLRVVKEDPADVRTLLKIGDLYVKKGSRLEACRTYQQVAETYAQQGFFLKAVAVFKQILKLDPSLLDAQLRLADMYRALGLVSDALGQLELIAGRYSRGGDEQRALAILRMMTEVDPENIAARIKVAEALSKLGQAEPAADEFAVGCGLLEQQGRIDDYVKVAERLLFHRADEVVARKLSAIYLDRHDPKRALAKLQISFKADPRDTDTLEMLARAFQLLGQTQKTVSVYRELARVHQDAGRREPRDRALARILELEPNDAEALDMLGRGDHGPSPRAVIPQSALVGGGSARAVPPSVAAPLPRETYEPEALEEHDALDEDAMEVLDDEAALESIAPDEPSSIPAPVPNADDEDDYEDSIVVTAATDDELVDDEVAETRDPEAEVARIITETDVFLRYGLKPKAVEHLARVFEIDPYHVEAREKMKDLLLDAGNRPAAAAQLFHLAQFFVSQRPQASIFYLRQVLDLDPAHDDAATLLERLGARRQSTRSFAPEARGGVSDAPAPGASSPSDRPLSADSLLQSAPPGPSTEPPDERVSEPPTAPQSRSLPRPRPIIPSFLAAPAPAVEARDELRASSDALNFLETDEGRLSGPQTDPGDVSAQRGAAEFVAPAHVITALDRADAESTLHGADDLDEMRPEEFDGPPAPRSAASRADFAAAPMADLDELGLSPDEFHVGPAPGPESAAPASGRPVGARASDVDLEHTATDVPGVAESLIPQPPRSMRPSLSSELRRVSVEEVLDEAEFFVSQGLADEARATLQELLTIHPNHPLVMERLAELDEQSSTMTGDDSFALAEKLAEEIEPAGAVEAGFSEGSDVLDVEQVFAKFKRGVEEQVGLEDSETHYDLGIAYKEMGLLDDAVAEFEIAMRNPQKECIAHTMIGLCCVDKGQFHDAISSFKKGLYADSKTDAEELGLYYELGAAYELLHDPKEALYYFQKVQKRDPRFRDTAERLRRLTTAEMAAPQDQPRSEDVDRAFDDLLSDRQDEF